MRRFLVPSLMMLVFSSPAGARLIGRTGEFLVELVKNCRRHCVILPSDVAVHG